MKISAKIDTKQNTNISLFVGSLLNELKERLIAVWSDFRQDIVDTAIDQCRKRLRTCVRANGGHLYTFCEQTLAKNLHFL